jgi:hypothetical protein
MKAPRYCHNFKFAQKYVVTVEVSEYHLFFDLNGVLMATREGPIRSQQVVLRLGLKKFLCICVKKFIVYIWSFAMRKNFARHLELIKEKNIVFLPSSGIVDQILCFRNEHFLPEKPEKPIFHKNLDDFFHMFLGTNYGKKYLVHHTPHKSMFNPPFSAISF